MLATLRIGVCKVSRRTSGELGQSRLCSLYICRDELIVRANRSMATAMDPLPRMLRGDVNVSRLGLSWLSGRKRRVLTVAVNKPG